MTIGQNPPKDDRLFARFAIEFPDSPKIKPLSDKAFRAWVEMVCWSRRHMTDGFIAEQAFATFGTPAARRELMNNDPHRPSVEKVEGGYLLHDFLDHQSSRAEIEAMKRQKSEAGQKGGKAKAAAKQTASRGVAGASDSASRTPSGPPSETYPESESASETPTTYVDRSSQVLNREGLLTDGESDSELCTRQAWKLYGVEFAPVRTAVAKATDTVPSPSGVMRIIGQIMGRAKGSVGKPTGYVITSIQNEWPQWQQFLHEEGLVA